MDAQVEPKVKKKGKKKDKKEQQIEEENVFSRNQFWNDLSTEELKVPDKQLFDLDQGEGKV